MTSGYTRRADLAGNTLKRLPYAVVRGAVRRKDPDGVVSEPYFDLGGVNTTLELWIPGPSEFNGTVIFAPQNATMRYILETINTAIGSAGTAYDLDGVVHIRSTVQGGMSYVAVRGGTAAAALGFPARAQHFVESYGGDLVSAPEARRGNPQGSVFPSIGENLSTDSFVRALGRLAGNDEVLHAVLQRPGGSTRLLSYLYESNQTLLDATTGSIVGGGNTAFLDESYFLGSTPSPERIATVFSLVDPTTQQPPISRIIDIRKNGSTIFGTKIALGSFPITEIRDSKVIVAPAGTFSATTDRQYVEITNDDSTANLVPWDHRGWWAIESYESDGVSDFLTLRPLSPGELNSVGGAQRPQPITELNGTLEAGKTYGTLTLYDYPTVTNIEVVVSPPLPPGMMVELWGPLVRSAFESAGAETVPHQSGRLLAAQDDSLPTAILTAPTVSATGTTVNYTEFYVRWNGRKARIPEGSASGDAIPSNGNAYALVWSSVSGRPEIRYAPSIAATDYLLARVWSTAPGVLQLSGGVRTDRLHGISARYGAIIHVGPGQECPDIQTAYSHMRAIAAGNGGWPAGGATFVLHGPTHDIGSSLGLGTGSADGVLRLVGATGTEKVRPTSNALALFQNVSSLFITDVGVDESLYTNWRWVAAVAGASYVWRKPSTSPSVPAEIEWARGNGVLNVLQNAEDGLYLARYASTARPLPGSPDRDVTINGGKVEASIANTGTVTLAPGAEALEITDNAAVKRSLTWDDLDLLVEAKNADTLHKHKAIEAGFTIGASATPASANVTTANLNTLTAGTSSNADSLHDHNASSLSADAYASGGLSAGTVQDQLRALADATLAVPTQRYRTARRSAMVGFMEASATGSLRSLRVRESVGSERTPVSGTWGTTVDNMNTYGADLVTIAGDVGDLIMTASNDNNVELMPAGYPSVFFGVSRDGGASFLTTTILAATMNAMLPVDVYTPELRGVHVRDLVVLPFGGNLGGNQEYAALITMYHYNGYADRLYATTHLATSPDLVAWTSRVRHMDEALTSPWAYGSPADTLETAYQGTYTPIRVVPHIDSTGRSLALVQMTTLDDTFGFPEDVILWSTTANASWSATTDLGVADAGERLMTFANGRVAFFSTMNPANVVSTTNGGTSWTSTALPANLQNGVLIENSYDAYTDTWAVAVNGNIRRIGNALTEFVSGIDTGSVPGLVVGTGPITQLTRDLFLQVSKSVEQQDQIYKVGVGVAAAYGVLPQLSSQTIRHGLVVPSTGRLLRPRVSPIGAASTVTEILRSE